MWQSLFVLLQKAVDGLLIPWFSSSVDAAQHGSCESTGIHFPNLLLALHVLGFKCSSSLWLQSKVLL